MGYPKEYRKFDGKRFTLSDDVFYDELSAKRAATKLRKKGYKVRRVKQRAPFDRRLTLYSLYYRHKSAR
jgi:hypothetical protein